MPEYGFKLHSYVVLQKRSTRVKPASRTKEERLTMAVSTRVDRWPPRLAYIRTRNLIGGRTWTRTATRAHAHSRKWWNVLLDAITSLIMHHDWFGWLIDHDRLGSSKKAINWVDRRWMHAWITIPNLKIKQLMMDQRMYDWVDVRCCPVSESFNF